MLTIFDEYSRAPVTSSALDQPTLNLLDESAEIEMRTPRQDGSISSRPIWVLVVDGDAYVRSHLATRGAWYRRALADGRAAIGVDSGTVDVGVEPAHDEDVTRRVSEAYRARYGSSAPGSTEEMVTPEVSRTTLRLTRA
jgi:hypothetical protein